MGVHNLVKYSNKSWQKYNLLGEIWANTVVTMQ